MFLLFFFMVAAGMLSLLWLYFPMQGSAPPETTPFQAPATVPAVLPSGALPQPPEAPVAAGAADPGAAMPAGSTPSAVTDAGAGSTVPVPGSMNAAPGQAAAPVGTPPGPVAPGLPPGTTSVEELDRLLEKLLGNAPPVPPTRP